MINLNKVLVQLKKGNTENFHMIYTEYYNKIFFLVLKK